MKAISVFLLLLLSTAGFSQASIDSGLVAFFPFCGNASDHSGQNNNGTVHDGVTFIEDRLGNPNSAAHFDGVKGFIQVPSSVSLDTLTDNMTLACWFYTKGYYSKWASLLSKSISTPALRQYSIIYDKNGLISFSHTLVATQILDLNQWYHIAITCQDSIAKCYVDGILIDSTYMANDIVPTNFPLEIGADPHIVKEFHKGMIDEVRIYNRALSGEEVSEISSHNFDCSTLAVNEQGNNREIDLYPNPTEGILTIESKEVPRNWSVEVYDAPGKLIQAGKLEVKNGTIDLTGINPGIYFIRIETEKGAFTNRIIKM